MEMSCQPHCKTHLLNQLASSLPTHVKVMIYNALILSRINNGFLAWGYETKRILKLQKKVFRIITLKVHSMNSNAVSSGGNTLK